jgi:hypothetical protein
MSETGWIVLLIIAVMIVSNQQFIIDVIKAFKNKG